MSVFVDTGVFYAQHDRDTERHESASEAMATVASGTYGKPYTSDYIYDETVTLTRRRTSYEPAMRVSDRMLGRGDFDEVVELVFVDRAVFDRAVGVLERYDDQRLSVTDATTVALVEARDIDSVLTFDDDFDGLVPRLDPTEV